MQAALQRILTNIKKYNDRADTDGIIKAYEYASKAHEGQFRQSGEKYIFHPLSVAEILTELEMDAPSIMAAILHDVVEIQASQTKTLLLNLARMLLCS